MEKFITIAVFDYIHEILKHRLIKKITVFFWKWNHVIFSMYLNALGGIKLKIHPNDFETVKAILQEMKR
jgi:hypothetical protein